jgi:hypothetical protein
MAKDGSSAVSRIYGLVRSNILEWEAPSILVVPAIYFQAERSSPYSAV